MANPEQLQRIFEAALMVAGRPLTVADLQKLFDEAEQPNAKEIREIIQAIQASYSERSVELREVASGFQFQAKAEFSPWLSRLWEERAPRFTRAFLETVALIAYRQPITRAEIEEIRGVAVSTNIIKTLQEREWIRVIGYRDVPGKPALYGTTKTFLDHLNLKALDELPPLSELIDIDSQEQKLQVQLELGQNTRADADSDGLEEQEHDTNAEHEHTENCSHDDDEDITLELDEEEHEHTEHCSHDEEDEDTILELDEEEHEHTENCSHADEDEDITLEVDEDEHEHTENCSHADDDEDIILEQDEDEHEHTDNCSHDDSDDIEHIEEDDATEITSDDYPKETSKA